MMNRRNFLGGLVTVCVAVQLPINWAPTDIKKDVAIKYLMKIYNDFAKGKGARHIPHDMYATKRLFEAFEGELKVNQRWVLSGAEPDHLNLAFKSVRLHRVDQSGWKAWF